MRSEISSLIVKFHVHLFVLRASVGNYYNQMSAGVAPRQGPGTNSWSAPSASCLLSPTSPCKRRAVGRSACTRHRRRCHSPRQEQETKTRLSQPASLNSLLCSTTTPKDYPGACSHGRRQSPFACPSAKSLPMSSNLQRRRQYQTSDCVSSQLPGAVGTRPVLHTLP